MRILFLSRWYPFPPDNGIRIRTFNLLKGISREHRVTLLSFHEPGVKPCPPDPASVSLEKLRVVPWREFDPGTLRSYRGLLSATPRSLVDVHSGEMQRLIEAEERVKNQDERNRGKWIIFRWRSTVLSRVGIDSSERIDVEPSYATKEEVSRRVDKISGGYSFYSIRSS